MWSWLFSTEGFLTRDECGVGWSDSLMWIYKISNFVIFLSYMSIPIVIILLWRKRRNDLASTWILLLFASFIFFCGCTHLNDILVFHFACYRFYTLIYILTALTSAGTAIIFPKVAFNIMKLGSREMIHNLNSQLNVMVLEKRLENDKLTERNEKLVAKIHILEGMLETNAWMHDKGFALQQLKEMLLTIGSEDSSDGG